MQSLAYNIQCCTLHCNATEGRGLQDLRILPRRRGAIDHSPGLQSRVTRPKTRPESGVRGVELVPTGTIEDWDVRTIEQINTMNPEPTLRPPLSGRVICSRHPELKPWAIMYSRFAVNPMAPSFLPTAGALHELMRSRLHAATPPDNLLAKASAVVAPDHHHRIHERSWTGLKNEPARLGVDVESRGSTPSDFPLMPDWQKRSSQNPAFR